MGYSEAMARKVLHACTDFQKPLSYFTCEISSVNCLEPAPNEYLGLRRWVDYGNISEREVVRDRERERERDKQPEPF